MTPTTDALLAQLSSDAYSATPVTLPAGFTALDTSNFGIALQAGESLSNGIYTSGNGAALVTVGFIEDLPTIVIAFRGSDDTQDSLQDLNGINAAYPAFTSLVAAVDQASAAWGIPVVVTGHSLGGSMAQLYMASHPNVAGEPGHAAVTFGSAGAILPAGTDDRITNYVIADDPAVVLGAHRAEIGDFLRNNTVLVDPAAERIAAELPGITAAQARESLPNLTVNYDNHGNIVLLPTADGKLDYAGAIAGVAALNADRHDVSNYVTEVQAAWSGTGPGYRVVPDATTGDQQLDFLHALYDGDNRTPGAEQAVVNDLLGRFGEDLRDDLQQTGQDIADTLQPPANDAFTTVRDGLTGIGQDLNLI
ncbi:alpha/beta hydrolase family protein [Paracraurococcus lichenis]|uniref:DUF2974 domain-containing protein n=1 Tax=Paracraurococcus lichenis TaxID=3064888 RepID=A0ABT9DZQ7_9PROT|nr:hypothetical protein [Paracraurococcus sp. LOR1-02]MDO9709393.1 hypothetical protein [Paracraurococcus sp. LOR1-02]